MSNWTILLLGLLAFFVIRGLVRGKRRRARENARELLGENNLPQTTSLIAGLALADFTFSGQSAQAYSAYHGIDASAGSGGFDAGGYSGGGDMGGGGGTGGG